MTGLSADNLVMRFDKFTAVDGIGFDVTPGEFVTLLGPSGCGKTTLLKMISGFLTPTEGRIVIGDKDVTRLPPEARDTALCFQSYALFPHLTVRENLEFGLKQKGMSAPDRKARVNEVAEQLELGAQLDKLPNQLSGGQQQRVSLGRALAMRPGVILFDEPLSNLDAKLRDQVRVEIRRIQRENGLTAIYVTHDQSEALAMSDRIFVMNKGRVEQADSPEAMYYRPRTKFVADFIGSANVFEGIASGGMIDTPIGQLSTGNSTAQGKTALCWRPEAARISETGTLSGRVVHRAFQGAFTDLLVETNGAAYRLQAPRTELEEGETVRFSIAPDDVILLEQGS
ncbi:ABC transporter ATP-binding protein [Paracoccus albus]|uniref:ABC transporter ATP-binding protein n=1 Tax=Paracoccus albus TaxID=3017784 RepID=UPI0022F00E2D|nr:ABC transporter ATP-binding protein [Paracoccus albus]WBU60842.1 ABC transporter ATP-binding protein [Paracoccus albus]